MFEKNALADELNIDSSEIKVIDEGNIINALNIKASIPNKKIEIEGDKSIYHVGARTGIMIQQIDENMVSANFNQNNIGLHHFCFRARERKDIDLLGSKLREMKAEIIRGPMEGNWAPGYYYILFEDPDGIRLEVNYVPGAGVLDKNNKFNSNKDYL